MTSAPVVSDGSTASYYELPPWARELQDLIRYKQMNGAQAEMFRAIYRGAAASHSDEQRQAKKILCYAVEEMVRTHWPERSFAEFRDEVFAVLEEVATRQLPKTTPKWESGNTPSNQGVYAIYYCWEGEKEGAYGIDIWEDDMWESDLPVVRFAGPFSSFAEATNFLDEQS